MTSVEGHAKNIRELLRDIEEKIRSDLILERQKLVGFAASEVACELLALLLHKRNLISPGFNINHRFFASEKSARERFNFDFPEKDSLLPLFVSQEDYRTSLCYGKVKEKKVVEDAIKNMYKIKLIIEKEIGEVI